MMKRESVWILLDFLLKKTPQMLNNYLLYIFFIDNNFGQIYASVHENEDDSYVDNHISLI
jgi:hypothetical protein